MGTTWIYFKYLFWRRNSPLYTVGPADRRALRYVASSYVQSKFRTCNSTRSAPLPNFLVAVCTVNFGI
eukprot:1393598-Ditylum_brightwellii.AAC.1